MQTCINTYVQLQNLCKAAKTGINIIYYEIIILIEVKCVTALTSVR